MINANQNAETSAILDRNGNSRDDDESGKNKGSGAYLVVARECTS